MKYEFKCTNIQCKKRNEVLVIEKPMVEAGTSEYWQECKEPLQKIFGSPAVRTGDGYKS
jgi:hypothetical protein